MTTANPTNPSTDYACIWTKYWDWVAYEKRGQDVAYWETACGGASTADEGILTEDFRYCHRCGKPIQEITKEYERERYEAEEDPDEARMEVIRREWGYVGRG